MPAFRLRQFVIACQHKSDIDRLKDLLGLGAPFVDPEVGDLGLTNAVFPIGDQFLEIIVPISDDAPAQRFINKRGPRGYMLIFQTDDLAAARARCDEMGIRRVADLDREKISASHLHPADIGAAIVSIDEANPPDGWPWAGPDWRYQSVIGYIPGADITSPAPAALAAKWAKVLDLPVEPENGTEHIWLDEGPIRFNKDEKEAVTSCRLHLPDTADCLARADAMDIPRTGNHIHFCGVDLILEEA